MLTLAPAPSLAESMSAKGHSARPTGVAQAIGWAAWIMAGTAAAAGGCGQAHPALVAPTIEVITPASAGAPAPLAPPPPPVCSLEALPQLNAAKLGGLDPRNGDLWPMAQGPEFYQLPKDAPAPLRQRCKALLKATTAKLRSSREFDDFGECTSAGKGAWVLEASQVAFHLTGMSGVPSNLGTGVGVGITDVAGVWTLAYVDPQGTVIRQFGAPVAPSTGPHAPGGKKTAASAVNTVNGDFSASIPLNSTSIYVHHDYDGDGVDEVILETHSMIFGGGLPTTTFRGFTFRDGSIWPWPKGDLHRVQSVVDVDGDGRPDLLLESSFRSECVYEYFEGPQEVAHAQRGASDARGGDVFSTDDPVARAAVRLACPGAPSDPLVARADPDDPRSVVYGPTIHNIACARFWGASTESILKRLRAQLPPEPKDPKLDACGSNLDLVLKEEAKVKPPFLLLPAGSACVPPEMPPRTAAAAAPGR